MCTPALPNPMPANVAASIMSVRASRSPPFNTALRNDLASRCSAFSVQVSEIGFAPL